MVGQAGNQQTGNLDARVGDIAGVSGEPAARAQRTERHFYRCLACLEVQAIDGPRLRDVFNVARQRYEIGFCDCGGALSYMGRVRGLALVQRHLGCPCDARCTDATGPNCDCTCGGRNHGTKRVVDIEVTVGAVPVIKARTDLAGRLERVAEFKAAKDAAVARIDAATGGAITAANNGERVSHANWSLKNELVAEYRKARGYLTHKRRIAALNAVAQRVSEAA